MRIVLNFLVMISAFLHSADGFDSCSPSSVSALSAKGAMLVAIQCSYSVRMGSYTNQSDLDSVISNCLNRVLSLDPTKAPVAGTPCRICYQGMIVDLIHLSVGRMISGSFVATTSSFNTDCAVTTTLAGQERCMKTVDIREPLVTFSKCSGYSILFPAPGDLKERRVLNRSAVFGNLLRYALGTNVVLSGDLAQVVAPVNSVPTPTSILQMELCYLAFVKDLQDSRSLMANAVIIDCASSNPTTLCTSDGNVVGAMTRFFRCTNFMIDKWYDACDADTLSKIYGNFDAVKSLVPLVITNYAASSTDFATAITPVTYEISQFGSSDCAECFRELALDIKANIVNRRASFADETFASFLNYCKDPHGSNCPLMIGTVAISKFKECSGFDLDLQAVPTSTPTAVAYPSSSTTAPTTTAGSPGNSTDSFTKSSESTYISGAAFFLVVFISQTI